jgi:hypothetical protein
MGNINPNTNTKPNSTKEIKMKKDIDTNTNTNLTKEIDMSNSQITTTDVTNENKGVEETIVSSTLENNIEKEMDMENINPNTNTNLTKEIDMNNSQTTTTDATNENKGVEETIVSSTLEKEIDMENTNLTKEIDMNNSQTTTDATNENKDVKETIVSSDEGITCTHRVEEVKNRYAILNKGREGVLYEKIQFGSYLLDTKKSLGNDFYKYITNGIISNKQVCRFIKLILTHESNENFAQGMSHKNKEPEKIRENLNLLIEDARVTSLTKEQISEMIEPTEETIKNAKFADTQEDFLKAIAGDDEVLKTIKNKKSILSKHKKDESNKKLDEKASETEKNNMKRKPDNMKEETYKNLLNTDKIDIIGIYQALLDEFNEYKNKFNEDASTSPNLNISEENNNIQFDIVKAHANLSQIEKA